MSMAEVYNDHPIPVAGARFILLQGQHEELPPDDAPEEIVDAYKSGLPPEEVRLLDPQKHRIPTPQDAQGFIDVPQLITDVNATIDPSYQWPAGLSRHHIYWEGRDYHEFDAEHPGSRAVRFRELKANKVRIPKQFENWLHVITEPPVMPEPEVMWQVSEAWLIANRLFKTVRETMQTIRIVDRARKSRDFSEPQEEIVERMLLHDLAGVARNVAELSQVPMEYWPFNPQDKAQFAAGQIGCVLIRGAQRRTRAVYLRDVA